MDFILNTSCVRRGDLGGALDSIDYGSPAPLIVISSVANLVLLSNYEKSPNVFLCRMTFEKISEISPPAALLFPFFSRIGLKNKQLSPRN